jgi:hypothetical protein
MRILLLLFAFTSCAATELEQCQSEVRRGKYLTDDQCLAHRSLYRNQDHYVQRNENKEMLNAIDRSPASYYMEQERNVYCGIKPLVPNHCRLHCIEGVWQRDCGED